MHGDRSTSPLRGAAGGAAAVEFALVLPVLLLLVLGAIEFGRAMWVQATLSYAVQAAARCAQTNPSLCGSPNQIRNFAAAAAPGLGLSADNVAVTSAACGVVVNASQQLTLVMPWVATQQLTLAASACYPP